MAWNSIGSFVAFSAGVVAVGSVIFAAGGRLVTIENRLSDLSDRVSDLSEGVDVDAVAAKLAEEHADKLRGQDGQSVTVDELADRMFEEYVVGAPGSPANDVDIDQLARSIFDQYGAELAKQLSSELTKIDDSEQDERADQCKNAGWLRICVPTHIPAPFGEELRVPVSIENLSDSIHNSSFQYGDGGGLITTDSGEPFVQDKTGTTIALSDAPHSDVFRASSTRLSSVTAVSVEVVFARPATSVFFPEVKISGR